MLLKDGKPYNLSDPELKENRDKMTWHVTPKPYDTVNNRHGIGSGIAFPNSYVRIKQDGSRERITYYTQTMYDDSAKRERYLNDNTGELIVIGEAGTLITSNPELNWFLTNCPWNGSNALRDGSRPDPYGNTRKLFWRYNPTASHRLVQERNRARKELQNVIDIEGDHAWSDFSIIVACKSVLADREHPIPQAIVDYQEYEKEEGTPTLRGALSRLIEEQPLWLKNVLITGRIFHSRRLLDECLANSIHTGLEYSIPERKFTIRKNKKGTVEDWVIVPEGRDPNKYIVEALLSDYHLFEKLQKLHDLIPTE